jgi:hypothetical protein
MMGAIVKVRPYDDSQSGAACITECDEYSAFIVRLKPLLTPRSPPLHGQNFDQPSDQSSVINKLPSL